MRFKLSEHILLEGGKKLYLTAHSKQRIDTRRISHEDIQKTFQHPDIIVPNVDYSNARNYIKTINNGRDKLKIGVKDDHEPFVLITAFIQHVS